MSDQKPGLIPQLAPREPVINPYTFDVFAASLVGREVRLWVISSTYTVVGTLVGLDHFSLLIASHEGKSKLTVVARHAMTKMELA